MPHDANGLLVAPRPKLPESDRPTRVNAISADALYDCGADNKGAATSNADKSASRTPASSPEMGTPHHRNASTRRPAAGLRKRAVLTMLVLLPLAGFSGAFSLALAAEKREPQLSQELYRALPGARTHLSDQILAQHFADMAPPSSSSETDDRIGEPGTSVRDIRSSAFPSPETRQGVEGRALSALRSTAYSSAALRQLALFEPEPARKAALLALSQRVSRRDPIAAAQLAQHHLASGRPALGLAALDRALSVSRALDSAIFPLLLEAAQSPELKAPFAAMLRRDPVWAERLALFARSDSERAARFARIAHLFPESSSVRGVEHGSRLVDLLANARRPEEALIAYTAFSPAAPDASAFGTRPLAPVDWRLIDGGDVGARLLGRDDAGQGATAVITAKAGRSGEIAQLLADLSPGRHELVLTYGEVEGARARLSLEQSCIADGQEWTNARVSAGVDGAGSQLAFDVPPGCPFQLLRLRIDAPAQAVRAIVRHVSLVQVRGAS